MKIFVSMESSCLRQKKPPSLDKFQENPKQPSKYQEIPFQKRLFRISKL